MASKPAIIDGRAIDPLALVFPGPVYIKITEGRHPHVPKVEDILAALREMTSDDRKAAVNRAKALIQVGKLVE